MSLVNATNGTLKIKTRAEQLVEMRHGQPVEALLRRLYVAEGMTQEEVAKALGIGQRTVIRWMAAYQIPTRDRRKVAA